MKKSVLSIAIKNLQVLPLVALGSAIALSASGCRFPCSSGGIPRRILIGGLDGSGSWRGNLGQGVLCITAQAQTMDATHDAVHVYRVDRKTVEFTGEGALDDPDRFQAEVIEQMRSLPRVNGTYPAKFWTAAARAAEGSRRDCVLELFSDGDNDDESDGARERLKLIGNELAADRRVKGVWFFGISSENRAYWGGLFGALGDRLHFCSPGQMTPEHAVAALSP